MSQPSEPTGAGSDAGKQLTAQMRMWQTARVQTTFDIEGMTRLIYGGADIVRRRREAWARVEARTGAEDTSRLPRQYAKTSREELYIDGLELGKAAFEDRAEYGHDFFDWISPRYTRKYYPASLCPHSPEHWFLPFYAMCLG